MKKVFANHQKQRQKKYIVTETAPSLAVPATAVCNSSPLNDRKTDESEIEPSEKLVYQAMTFLKESYTVQEPAEIRQQKRDYAIDFLEQAFLKYENRKAIAVLHSIYYVIKLQNLRPPSNLYILKPILENDPQLLSSYPILQSELATIATDAFLARTAH